MVASPEKLHERVSLFFITIRSRLAISVTQICIFHGLDFEPYMKNVALLFGHFTLIIRFAGAERDYLSNLGIVPLPISST